MAEINDIRKTLMWRTLFLVAACSGVCVIYFIATIDTDPIDRAWNSFLRTIALALMIASVFASTAWAHVHRGNQLSVGWFVAALSFVAWAGLQLAGAGVEIIEATIQATTGQLSRGDTAWKLGELVFQLDSIAGALITSANVIQLVGSVFVVRYCLKQSKAQWVARTKADGTSN